MKIIAHTLIKNEENFIWYTINSVLDYLDGILIYLDDRSDDKTESIIKTIKSSKIVFKKKSPRNLQELGNLRQEMLEETNADWIFILDGDEIWHSETIAGLKSRIYDLKDEKDLIVSPNYMLIGDMFHYQPEEAGKYRIANRQGNYNVRFIRKGIPGLHAEGAFLHEGYADGRGIKIQDLGEERIYFSDEKYLHASFLKKPRFEIGKEFPKDFYYPEVFFRPRPSIVPSLWQPMTKDYKLRAFIETPLKKLKRRLI
jgi:glycosyltransferase involved in cell wall biosynthesis